MRKTIFYGSLVGFFVCVAVGFVAARLGYSTEVYWIGCVLCAALGITAGLDRSEHLRLHIAIVIGALSAALWMFFIGNMAVMAAMLLLIPAALLTEKVIRKRTKVFC